MRARFFKRIWAVMLSACLVFSQAFVSFADSFREMEPDDYLFLVVFRACGVSPGVDVGRWVGFYKGYLRSIGNESLLSQVEGYASLNWGDTAQGVDAVFNSVKEWLSLSDSYGTESTEYSLPSSPSRQTGEISSKDEVSVLTTPFPEITYGEPGYHYVFSQAYGTTNGATARYNIYIPDGVEIIGLLSPYYDYYEHVKVSLYMVDASSPSGYSSSPAKYKYSILNADGTFRIFDNVISIRDFMPNTVSVFNCPFYVFNSAEDMENYCKTGAAENVFNNNSCFAQSLGKDGGLDPELQKTGIASLGSSMVLPGSLDEASASVKAFQKQLSRDELMSVLNKNGMNAVYCRTAN